jgi:calcineurin-like phosphoesterase family protein
MASTHRIAILSDIHYAGAAEQERGPDYEFRHLANRFQRLACGCYRRYFWLRAPMRHNHLLDDFLAVVGEPDHVFALGDYNCDSAFVGVSDDAALSSASECLGKLRQRFGDRLHPLIGDHELGKFPLFGRRGGLRFESWRRSLEILGLRPFWKVQLGDYACLGITSSLLTLPAMSGEILESERDCWAAARAQHLDEIRAAFESLRPQQRILLFCHDPTALPFLWEEAAVRDRIGQVERTLVGHLHSPLILWKSRRLAGMPTISFLGHTAKRLSGALGRARGWKPFNVALCPSLAGIELLKDGGFCTAELENQRNGRLRLVRHRIPR